jgi:hypothetical protein
MMDGSALRGDAGPEPGWTDFRRAVIIAAEITAAAAVSLAMRGPHGMHAAMMVREAADGLRNVGMQAAEFRHREFNETVIDAEADRRAREILAAAGLVPPPPPGGRHLRAV